MNTPPVNTTVIFREINREDPTREMPGLRGKIAYLHSASDQKGVAYEAGITKVWICLEDVEILGVSL